MIASLYDVLYAQAVDCSHRCADSDSNPGWPSSDLESTLLSGKCTPRIYSRLVKATTVVQVNQRLTRQTARLDKLPD